jgi:hypothetical protein
MTYCKIEPGTTITTHSYENLVAVYEQYKSCRELIREFVMTEPLTEEQMCSLPGALRKQLTFPDASVESLERLASLPDLRD